jgi:serine/threonine protein kinase
LVSEKEQAKAPILQDKADATIIGIHSDTMTGAPVAVPIPVASGDVQAPNGYQIESIIGRGGMSVVYKAKHLLLNKAVAIKLLHSHLSSDEHALKRFRQEALSASKLDHPGIITIHDFGIIHGKNTAYLCMDYVDGPSLCSLIGDKPIAPRRALVLCRKICEALQHAHDQGVVHRDIKPSNVLITNAATESEDIRIVDFGIAKILQSEDPHAQQMTRTGESVGSPPYMSPEQCQGLKLDARSDIYALGCMLYELITGQAPLKGATSYETIHLQMTALPESVSKSRANLINAEALDAMILKAVAKNPNNRFQSMTQFAEAIDKLLPVVDESTNPLTRMKLRAQVQFAHILNRPLIPAAILVTVILLPLLFVLNNRVQNNTQPTLGRTGLTHEQAPADARALYQDGLNLVDAHRYQEAKIALSRAMDTALEESGMTGAMYQNSLRKLIEIKKILGDSAEAAKLQQTLDTLKLCYLAGGDVTSNIRRLTELSTLRLSNPDDKAINTEYGKLINTQAWLYASNRNNKEALQMARDGLAFNKKMFGQNSPGATEAAIILAHIEGIDMQLDTAETDLKALVQQAQKHFGAHSWQVTQCQISLAKNSTRRLALAGANGDKVAAARYEREAIERLTEAEKTCQATFAIPSPWLASIYSGMASVYDLSWCAGLDNNLKKARTFAERAYDLECRLMGKNSFSAGVSLSGLGDIDTNIALGETNRSKQLAMLTAADKELADAQVLVEKCQLGESQRLAQILNQRAFAHEKMGDQKGAETFFRSAFTKARRWKSDSDLAKHAYAGLMRLYQQQGRTEDEATLMSEVQAKPAE